MHCHQAAHGVHAHTTSTTDPTATAVSGFTGSASTFTTVLGALQLLLFLYSLSGQIEPLFLTSLSPLRASCWRCRHFFPVCARNLGSMVSDNSRKSAPSVTTCPQVQQIRWSGLSSGQELTIAVTSLSAPQSAFFRSSRITPPG